SPSPAAPPPSFSERTYKSNQTNKSTGGCKKNVIFFNQLFLNNNFEKPYKTHKNQSSQKEQRKELPKTVRLKGCKGP
ncbi:hypothetical protein, partial [Agrobacterium sp.]|uniref:hypothetical protein n=1 Tax=Agrobacterium sp. TaxID=361 RepID=UPI0028A5E0DA